MATTTYERDHPAHMSTSARDVDHISGWATFASYLMIVTGSFQILTGLVALFQPDVYLVSASKLVWLDFTGWGWTLLLIGTILLTAGLSLLAGKMWGRIVAVIVATISALANFAFISAYPIWSILIIALDIMIIFSVVTRKGWSESE